MKARFAMFPLVCALAAMGVGPAAADNACKGLSQQACDGSQACSWVKAYVRQDGREVAPYCRARPAPSSTVKESRGSAPAAG